MSNLQWEQHKNGDTALMLGHIRVGLVIPHPDNSEYFISICFLPGSVKSEHYGECDRAKAKQWVEDKVSKWLELAGL